MPNSLSTESDAHTRMIHIVGLYKCGTTWLLNILAGHPQVIAWREFDPVRVAYHPDRLWPALLRSGWDYLRRHPSDAWITRREQAQEQNPEAIFRDMFLGRGWLPLMGVDKQQLAEALDPSNLENTLETLCKLGDLRLRPDSSPPLVAAEENRILGVRRFRERDLMNLMASVRDCNNAQNVPRLFFDALLKQTAPQSRVACKAADQLMQLSALQRSSPGATPIAIVRDARDATISARHYEQLMRQQEAPWRVGSTSSLRRLIGWSVRAAKLAEHARRGEIAVIRYEDLHADFAGTCTALLRHLNLQADPTLVAQLQEATQFSAMSGGRKSGHTAAHIVRKGQVGEWRDVLSKRQANTAWRLIGNELRDFGYSEDGQLQPSPLVLGA